MGINQNNLKSQQIRDTRISFLVPENQCVIGAEIEAEQALVNVNKQLIERFEEKINATIHRVLGTD
jgi:type I restriction enzyme M protein